MIAPIFSSAAHISEYGTSPTFFPLLAAAAAAQPANGGGSIDYGARLRDVTESDAYKMGSPAFMVQREAENFVPRSWDSCAEGDLEHSSENGGGVFGVALDSADDLRKAFVMSEIVSKPLSLRDDSERFAVW